MQVSTIDNSTINRYYRRMANKAFIFDLDGVLVGGDVWNTDDDAFLRSLFGDALRTKIGDTRGRSIDDIYQQAQTYGFAMPTKKYYELYDRHAAAMYAKSQVTPGMDRLTKQLLEIGFALGIVTSARQKWLNEALKIVPFKDSFSYQLACGSQPDLHPKPAPDGYLKVMKEMRVRPNQTIVLEDTETGIKSAKAAGAYVIQFNYYGPRPAVTKADTYSLNPDEVFRIASVFTKS